jgi:hypothetical protein
VNCKKCHNCFFCLPALHVQICIDSFVLTRMRRITLHRSLLAAMNILPVRTALHCTVWYCTAECCSAQCYTVVFVLYCTVSYCTILYWTTLHCTVLLSTVHYIVLCTNHTALHCTVLSCPLPGLNAELRGKGVHVQVSHYHL